MSDDKKILELTFCEDCANEGARVFREVFKQAGNVFVDPTRDASHTLSSMVGFLGAMCATIDVHTEFDGPALLRQVADVAEKERETMLPAVNKARKLVQALDALREAVEPEELPQQNAPTTGTAQ